MHLAQSQQGHTVTIARPLRLIYQHPTPNRFGSLLNDFSTVSTLQDCNFTSLSPKTFCSGPTVLVAWSPRLLSYSRIALACIRIRFFAGSIPVVGVFKSVVAKNAKNDKRKGMMREGRNRDLDMAGVSDCCSHCRDVLDLKHHHSYRLQSASYRGR